MKATEIKINDKVNVHGWKGTVVEVTDTVAYAPSGEGIEFDWNHNFNIEHCRYFKVKFDEGQDISGTSYDNAEYGGNHLAAYKVYNR